MSENKFLFEVSWEVCNKVGGIYTVLQTKLTQTVKNFGEDYVLIGPWSEQDKDFVEDSSPFLDQIKKTLFEKNISCHVGYWDVECKPKVILVDFKERYKIDALLYGLWVDYGVDSLASKYDYHEPILFSTVAGEIVSLISESGLLQGKQILAQFHEWMCGAGSLYLKKNCQEVATIFTTHATVLGRALSQENKIVSDLPASFDFNLAAQRMGVFAKHSLEKASAREADCFTTVSDITALETSIILNKHPDKIVYNGLDIEQVRKRVVPGKAKGTRSKLLQVAGQVIGKKISDDALLWITSGRYELHNKGYDLLLKSLAQLEGSLSEDDPPIVVFFLIAVNYHGKQDSLLGVDSKEYPEQQNAIGLATHKVYDPDSDDIIRLCNELNLKNPERKIHVVFSDAYLSGNDGVFDLPYEQILAGCDLSIFPSFYEPWGYTPLESIAHSTPTITSNLSGFGHWVDNKVKEDFSEAVFVLNRDQVDELKVISDLNDRLLKFVKKIADKESFVEVREKALKISRLADWSRFYEGYLEAYEQAIKFNKLSQLACDITASSSKFVTSIDAAAVISPRLRTFQYENILPEQISELRNLAYNFWWSWHEEAKELFERIDPVLWEHTKHNPVHFLNIVSSKSLQLVVSDSEYLELYKHVMVDFKKHIDAECDITKFCSAGVINPTNPVAYFCMEYGVDESLPIYSGGLGVLAGDYLKTMSDLHMSVVAVGLFYKNFYFSQRINKSGEQEVLYESLGTDQIPMKPVNDSAGKAILTNIEILGRTVYICAWEVKIGRISLYLLDTNVPENSEGDRKITNNLYGGSREVRLMQEMVLGIGGARFLVDKLNIRPALYHLNEGHSAFLLLERIRDLRHRGFSFEEVLELVRSSSVFTTHTPVPAGNENFSKGMVKKYLENYAVSRLGVSFDRLFELAKDIASKDRLFSMTALALRLTLNANAVSTLHGKVSRSMWQGIWPGLLESEVPIEDITNGVHLITWLGNHMRQLYEDYLPVEWCDMQHDKSVWEKIKDIPDEAVWDSHQKQKERLIGNVRQLFVSQYTIRNESKKLIDNSLRCLTSDTLLIGISRRFAAYKRNNLFLLDAERLARILTNEKRPVVILMAGKAHPADVVGKKLIREIFESLRKDVFKGHIIFLEEYNISLAKLLVQGVDVWLNTPILGREACGTSGMKVGVNGGLNFSTRDGWWDEVYSDKIGWQVESLTSMSDVDKRSDVESTYLLETLESEIVPLYYENKKQGANFNSNWVEKMKASIFSIASNYNSFLMAKKYIDDLYRPVALRNEQLVENKYAYLKKVVAWQHNVVERFNTVKIQAIFINGIKDGKIMSNGLLRIKVLLYMGKMKHDELRVEFVLMRKDDNQLPLEPIIISLQGVESGARNEEGVWNYIVEYQIEETGFYSYGVRVLPYNSVLFRPQDAKVVYWG